MVIAVTNFLNTSKGYMMNTATSAVVEEKMEPIAKSESTQQLIVTGQYLYESFIADSDIQRTKMDIVRDLIVKGADALQIKGACDKMVEIAKGIDGELPKGERGPKTQSAMNTRTVIQSAWGALKFANGTLYSLGYTDQTGYQDMRVLAKKALETARVDWKGEPLKTDAQREQAKLQKTNAKLMKELQDVQKSNPWDSKLETLQEWNARTFSLAQEAMQEAANEVSTKVVTAEFERLTKALDENQLYLLTMALRDYLPFELPAKGEDVAQAIATEEAVEA